LSLNLPNKYIHESDVDDALPRMLSRGLIEQVSGGLYKLNVAAAVEISRRAAEEEGRAYARPVERPVFRERC
jgi:hypothetical protein